MENGKRDLCKQHKAIFFLKLKLLLANRELKQIKRIKLSKAETYLKEKYFMSVTVTDRFLMKITQTQLHH